MKDQDGLIEMEAGSVDWEVTSDMIGVDEDGNELFSDDFVRINNLFVKHEFRGRGFARKLMEAADELIRKQYPGMKIKIVAEPKEESVEFDRLADFYASFGFEVVAY
jgi:GNAT superfamily N-acetyltransferase